MLQEAGAEIAIPRRLFVDGAQMSGFVSHDHAIAIEVSAPHREDAEIVLRQLCQGGATEEIIAIDDEEVIATQMGTAAFQRVAGAQRLRQLLDQQVIGEDVLSRHEALDLRFEIMDDYQHAINDPAQAQQRPSQYRLSL